MIWILMGIIIGSFLDWEIKKQESEDLSSPILLKGLTFLAKVCLYQFSLSKNAKIKISGGLREGII